MKALTDLIEKLDKRLLIGIILLLVIVMIYFYMKPECMPRRHYGEKKKHTKQVESTPENEALDKLIDDINSQ